MGRIYVTGIGPGDIKMMTEQARGILERCDVIVGYKTYTQLVKEYFPDKEYFENGMRGEVERCRRSLEFAKTGKTVALICSGDAGVYGMASPMLEIAGETGFTDVEIVPGVTAALSGSALLGAVLSNDFCVISLSDLLTPWETIEKRLKCAAEADLCMAVYNPASHGRGGHLKKACEILMGIIPGDRACGYVRNIGRKGCEKRVCTLSELAGENVDMTVTVFIGNSQTRIVEGNLVTSRGYEV